MAVKHKTLYLYLTLACFLGIILIFVFDGYIGVYDSLIVKAGEYPERIEADEWTEPYRDFSPTVEWGEKAFFSYEVDNRRFSAYEVDFEVSVWHGEEKVYDIIAQPISVAAFDSTELKWVMDMAELVPDSVGPDQSYEFTVVIKRGEIERSLIVRVSPERYAPKQVMEIPEPPR